VSLSSCLSIFLMRAFAYNTDTFFTSQNVQVHLLKDADEFVATMPAGGSI